LKYIRTLRDAQLLRDDPWSKCDLTVVFIDVYWNKKFA